MAERGTRGRENPNPLSSADVRRRAQFAQQAGLTPGQRRAVAKDVIHVLRARVHAPDLNEVERTHYGRHPVELVRAEWALHRADLSSQERKACLADPAKAVRCNFVRRADLTADEQWTAARDHDPEIRGVLGKRNDLLPELAYLLFTDTGVTASNTDLSRLAATMEGPVVEAALKESDPRVLARAARFAPLDRAQRRLVLNSSDELVRSALASRPAGYLSRWELEELAHDGNWRVRAAIARHAELPAGVRKELTRDQDVLVRRALHGRADLDPKDRALVEAAVDEVWALGRPEGRALAPETSVVPDVPILGYRTWLLEPEGLTSVRLRTWWDTRRIKAVCSYRPRDLSAMPHEEQTDAHRCGMHAYHSLDNAIAYTYPIEYGYEQVMGAVLGHGGLQLYEEWWRAEEQELIALGYTSANLNPGSTRFEDLTFWAQRLGVPLLHSSELEGFARTRGQIITKEMATREATVGDADMEMLNRWSQGLE
jgi:hypothetical protein